MASSPSTSSSSPCFDPTKIRALLFDVFGTCVDWRTTVTTVLHAQARTTLSDPTASLATTVRLRATDLEWDDWARFAQEWRDEYKAFVQGAAKALEESERGKKVQQKEKENGSGSNSSVEQPRDEMLEEWEHHVQTWPVVKSIADLAFAAVVGSSGSVRPTLDPIRVPWSAVRAASRRSVVSTR